MQIKTREPLALELASQKNLRPFVIVGERLHHQNPTRWIGERAKKLRVASNKLALKAVFGPRVFQGEVGRAFKALSEYEDVQLPSKQMREVGQTLVRAAIELTNASHLMIDHFYDEKSRPEIKITDEQISKAMHTLKTSATHLSIIGQGLIQGDGNLGVWREEFKK